jgi:hypothetical protein
MTRKIIEKYRFGHVCGLKGHESIEAQALVRVGFFIGHSPHKALPSSALLEKHPVRRVGGAEGAAENRTRQSCRISAQSQLQPS